MYYTEVDDGTVVNRYIDNLNTRIASTCHEPAAKVNPRKASHVNFTYGRHKIFLLRPPPCPPNSAFAKPSHPPPSRRLS